MMAFTSSVSTCMGPGYTGATVTEEVLGSDPTVALSTGYALSKYIGSSILINLYPPYQPLASITSQYIPSHFISHVKIN